MTPTPLVDLSVLGPIGFVAIGSMVVLVGAYLASPGVAIVATSGVVLAAAYMLWMYRRVMFGPLENPENRGLIDLGLREKVVMVAIVIPIVWIGVYPDPFLRRIEPSVIALLRTVEERAAIALAETGSEVAETSGGLTETPAEVEP